MIACSEIVSLVPSSVALRSVRHALLDYGGVVDRDPLLQVRHLVRGLVRGCLLVVDLDEGLTRARLGLSCLQTSILVLRNRSNKQITACVDGDVSSGPCALFRGPHLQLFVALFHYKFKIL